MKFVPLKSPAEDMDALSSDYRSGHGIGVLTLGDRCLFFKRRFTVYYIFYQEADRFFRRVQMVPARLCCGRGDFQVENLVICSEGKELAMVQLPGTRAAEAAMEELKEKAPDCSFGKPDPAPAPAAAEA